jgi:MazG family protein
MSDSAAELFGRLVDVVRTLREPGGCPWDREQTLATLRPFVLEEAYEVLQAIDHDDRRALGEEIGDFIFEGVLLAQVASEAGDFTIADSLASIVDKLIRRHAHVFGDAERARTASEVLGRWEAVKADERASTGGTRTILSGVPVTLPSLLRAHEMGTRAAAVGFDWERATDVVAKIEEEVAELRQAVEYGDLTAPLIEEEMGDLLFAIANLSRKLGVEPEAALRKANDKFARRFTAMERAFASRGRRLQETTLDEMESTWGEVKRAESHQPHED